MICKFKALVIFQPTNLDNGLPGIHVTLEQSIEGLHALRLRLGGFQTLRQRANVYGVLELGNRLELKNSKDFYNLEEED